MYGYWSSICGSLVWKMLVTLYCWLTLPCLLKSVLRSVARVAEDNPLTHKLRLLLEFELSLPEETGK